MPKLETYEAGNLALRPTETGIDATVQSARRLGAFANQSAGATEMLSRETDRLAGLTNRLGSETSNLGAEKGSAMREAGRAIGGGISEAGDAAVKYLDHQQISQGSASWATMLQEVTNDWNNRVKNADPNDPHVATNFMDSLNKRLAEFQEQGFYTENGQKWAESHTEALRQHMVEKTTADMSMLAGEAVKINHRQTVNSLSATVHDDPSSIDFALAGLKSSAEGLISSSPNLRGTDVAKVRGELQQTGAEAIVKSAAIGYIEKTGKMPDWVKDPKYSGFVNGAELKMLEKAAQTQQKVDLLQQKQLEKYQREQQERAATAEHSKNFTDNVKFDDNGKPIINPNFFKSALDIERKYPGAGTTETRAMLNWGEAQQNKELKPVTDPAVQSDLYTRMVSTDKPTTRAEILSNAAQGKLDAHATKTLLDLNEELNQSPLKGPIWKDTMDAVKGRMIKPADPLYGDKDAIGMGNYAKFAQTFIPQYLAKQRAGTLEPNALDVNDPNSLISKNIAAINNGRSMQSDLRKAATSTAPASAAPRNDVMPAVPPPDQRPSGSIYETPRGKMKWTGTGWVQP